MNERNNERVWLSPPHLSGEEIEFVKQAFAGGYIAPTGPELTAFENQFRDYTGIPHCVAVSSGTAAMHLALHDIVKPGTEVFASTLTFVGGVSPIRFLNAKPVFIDSDRTSWNMDPNLLEEEVTRCRKANTLPSAVVPTDLYGQCSDLDAIKAICDPLEIPVIVDSAEAMGATYKGKHAGVGGKASVYSFNGNKIITTSGGGMLASDDGELIARARFLSTQARENFPWYEHESLGFNYRMSNILAAIGIGQLKALDERVSRTRAIFERYASRFTDVAGISLMPEANYGRSNRWLTVIQIDASVFGVQPEQIRLALEAKNIESRSVWKPMHMQPVFANARSVLSGVSESLFAGGLCLPSGTAMCDETVDRVADCVLACGR